MSQVAQHLHLIMGHGTLTVVVADPDRDAGEIVLPGFLLGLICGMITGTVGFLMNMTNPEVAQLAVSVFVGMISALTAAATIGTIEPLILHHLKQDPAVSSGPLITAVNDLMGTTMYLLVATFLQR